MEHLGQPGGRAAAAGALCRHATLGSRKSRSCISTPIGGAPAATISSRPPRITAPKLSSRKAISPTRRDFRSTLVRVRDANPDGLILISYYSDGALIARQARQVGPEADDLRGELGLLAEISGAWRRGRRGRSCRHRYFPEDPRPEVRKFVSAFKAKYDGQEPDAFNAYSYDAMNVAAAVLQNWRHRSQSHPGRFRQGKGRADRHFRARRPSTSRPAASKAR